MASRLKTFVWVATVSAVSITLAPRAAAAPPAAKGFQISYQLGPTFPVGKATGEEGDTLAGRYNWMLEPALFSVGARFAKYWFVGGYFGAAFGARGANTRVKQACRDNDFNLENDIACTVVTLRAGLEARFNLRPATSINPWLGYGIGPVFGAQAINDRVIDRRESTQLTGWEYARFSTGVTFRTSKLFGIGPYANASIGRFLSQKTIIDGQLEDRARVEQRALHAWIGIGLRMEFFP